MAEQTVVWRLDLHDTTHTQHTNLVRRCSLYLVESNQLLNYTKTRKAAENGVTSMDGIARVLRSFMSEVVLVLTLAFRLLRLFKSATRPRRSRSGSPARARDFRDSQSLYASGDEGSFRSYQYQYE